MNTYRSADLTLRVEVDNWPLKSPFRIKGYTTTELEVVTVTLEQYGYTGWGEAAGVHYRGDNARAMVAQLENARASIESGINTRKSLGTILPPGGARNAVDCALWDLEAKRDGCPAWQSAGLEKPRPLLTTFTCGADSPEHMAATARAYVTARAIKLKLTGESIDADRVRAVREARGDVWLAVDANQGFTRDSLLKLMPVLSQAQVSLIEQPFPIGQEALLDGFQSPVPIAADESVQTLSDMPSLMGRFDVVNIKLDKCGGLSQALAMVREARELGMKPMVGNMLGTSLAMAPAFLAGQLCEIVDLDGPVFLKGDRAVIVGYADGFIECPEEIWGYPMRFTNSRPV